MYILLCIMYMYAHKLKNKDWFHFDKKMGPKHTTYVNKLYVLLFSIMSYCNTINIYIWTFFNNKNWSWTSQPREMLGRVCGIHHLGGKPTVRSVMLFGVINTLFSCTRHLFTSETLVHHDRVRSYQMACGGSLRSISISEWVREMIHTKCSLWQCRTDRVTTLCHVLEKSKVRRGCTVPSPLTWPLN